MLDEAAAKKVIVELLRKIDSKTPLAFDKAVGDDPNRYDLSITGERSLWALEQLLGCEFPHDMSKLDKSKIYEKVVLSMMYPTNLLDRTYEYQLELAKNPKTAKIDLERLAASPGSEVRLLLAQNPAIPDNILSRLVGDSDPAVSKAAMAQAGKRGAGGPRGR